MTIEDQMITITVDGEQLRAKPGQMLIDVTDSAGITIPRFCYHKKLSIAANCRMCLVEVENAPKPLPACATPCNDGMTVYTKSPLAREAQKGTMEFLLINHPLDCPICDQGGECELQDVALGYGNSISRYTEGKRVVEDPDLGPLVATDMTRCIHCTRCVRFGEEIAGLRELGATGRGEHMKIGTYVAHTMHSELSGNIIDLCPVGALTSKPYRFTARPWEMTQHDSIAAHDCVGSNISVHVRNNQVMRVIPRENEDINETWISDPDRFSYTALGHEERLTRPIIKKNGQWQEVEWDEALNKAALTIEAARGGDQLGTLVSPSATLEEMVLASRLSQAMGSKAIDYRVATADFRHKQTMPWLGLSLSELEQADCIVLILGNPRKEQPLLNHRIRKAALRGCRVIAINAVDFESNFNLESHLVLPSAVLDELSDNAIKEALATAQNGVVLVGEQARMHPDYSLILYQSKLLADTTNARFGVINTGSNEAGAWLAGALDKDADQHILELNKLTWLLLGIEPEHDCLQGQGAIESLKNSESVIALTAWRTAALEDAATIMLPIGLYPETSGTRINCQLDIQSFTGCVTPPGEVRPAWKVLRVLGNFLNCEGFTYTSSEEIRDKFLTDVIERNAMLIKCNTTEPRLQGSGIQRLATRSSYCADGLVRRAGPLQQSTDPQRAILMHPETAQLHGLEDGDSALIRQNNLYVTSPIRIDERVIKGVVWYPTDVRGSDQIGSVTGEIVLEAAS